MSLLSDIEITKRCSRPEHLTGLIPYLKKNANPAFVIQGDYEKIEAAIAELGEQHKHLERVIPIWASQWIGTYRRDLTSYVTAYGDKPMIEPFVPHLVRTTDDEATKLISYGLSSYGYDARLTEEVKTFTNINGGIVDPKNFDGSVCVDTKIFDSAYGEYVVIPPQGFILGSTLEWFRIPRNTTVICLGKSTIARCGVVCITTPLEAGWEGNVTIELVNPTPLPVKVYLGEGVCQFLFLESDYACKTSYADRAGKYQGQKGLTLPRV